MKIFQNFKWFIAIIFLVVLFSSFFIFMNESQELFSSLFAAIMTSILVIFAAVILHLLVKVFKK